jgi:hypothetical protein
MKLLLCCAVLCCALPVVVAANIAPPRYAPPRDWSQMKLVVEHGPAAREATLWLPSEFNQSASGAVAPGGMSSTQTAVSGGALSLGLVLGGLWLVRSRRSVGTRAGTAAAAALCVLAGTAGYAFANAAAPRPLDPGTLRLASPSGEPLQGQVRIRYHEEPGVVRLVLPAPKPETSKHGE